jgi:hypothetical protein
LQINIADDPIRRFSHRYCWEERNLTLAVMDRSGRLPFKQKSCAYPLLTTSTV